MRSWIFTLVTFTFCMSLLSCEESLPTRNEPENLIVGDFRLNSYRINVCASTSSPMIYKAFSVGIKNIFDETLQNSMKISVDLTLWTKYWPDVKRNIHFEKINPNEIITIDPGTTYWIDIEWDHKDDNGNYIWDAVRPAVNLSKWGNEIEFYVSGTIQVFSNVQSIPTEEFEFTLLYVLNEKC